MSAAEKKQKTKQKLGAASRQEGKIDYTLIYNNLRKKFVSTKKPVEVDFRKLVEFHSGIDRYTHLLHTYPAKLLLNIPFFFINCCALVKKNAQILDPFCGSGTVLLEGIVAGKDVIGADANPLARLITKAKTTMLPPDNLNMLLLKIISEAKKTKNKIKPQDLVNWSHWYFENVSNQLGRLGDAIENIDMGASKNFFLACFSSCVRKVSLADPTVSVPVRLNPKRYKDNKEKERKIKADLEGIKNVDVLEVFDRVAKSNIKRMGRLYARQGLGKVKNILKDAKNLKGVKDKSIDLIITSPPYAGAQKYIRSSTLSIGWLKLSPDNTLRSLERQNIGREHYSKNEYQKMAESPAKSSRGLLQKIFKNNPLRAHIATNYLIEMRGALTECYRVLKKEGLMVLVLGNNVVCGKNFETQVYIREICRKVGFKTDLILRDKITSRGLMTKRNKTASVITCEWIIVLKKIKND